MSEPEGTRTAAARTLRAAARGEPAAATARLQVLDGPLAGRSLALGEEETVGRGCDASLPLPDPAASRCHLRLQVAAGTVTAADLGSKNGSLLNRRRLRGARRLRAGDELTVGTTRLRLEGAPVAAPPRQAHPAARPAPLLLGAALALLAAAVLLATRA